MYRGCTGSALGNIIVIGCTVYVEPASKNFTEGFALRDSHVG